MKKIIFILSLALFINDISAQQDAQFSQNMFNKLANNPGFTGSNQAISVIGLFRDQWSGFEGAPQTTNLSVHAPISALRGGLGLSVFSDQEGEYDNTNINLSIRVNQNSLNENSPK